MAWVRGHRRSNGLLRGRSWVRGHYRRSPRGRAVPIVPIVIAVAVILVLIALF